ncbi:MAG: hypothetical protein Q4C49_01090 [Bacillota bacterium]|nr:hypothetical protein [Bacillota bacterium]
MEQELEIALTLTERGAILPRKAMSLEKQRKLNKKVEKIKKLEAAGKELYPWQKQLLWEADPRPKFRTVKTKIRLNADATYYLMYESFEGCPRGYNRKEFEQNKKEFMALPPKERAKINLQARYSDYFKVDVAFIGE